MSDATLDKLISTLPQILLAVATLVGVLKNMQQTAHIKEQGKEIKTEVKAVAEATNGMKDQIVKVTAESEYAKGLLEGKATPNAASETCRNFVPVEVHIAERPETTD